MALDDKAFAILKKLAPLGNILLLGRPDSAGAVKDPVAAIRELGASVTVLDNLPDSDIIHDLNEPLQSPQRFDTIFDCGTIEHIANIGQCLRTYHQLLRVGGRLVVNTMSDGFQTHGFFQLNPQLFYSLFSQANGYGETICWSYRGILSNWSRMRVEPRQTRQEFRIQLPRLILAIAQKTEDKPLSWPSQPYWVSPQRRSKPMVKLAMVWDIARSAIASIQ